MWTQKHVCYSAVEQDDESLRIRVGYFGTQLGHSTRASTSTERESIRLSIAFAAIASVVPAQWQLAAPGKINSSPRGDESYETIKFTRVFF